MLDATIILGTAFLLDAAIGDPSYRLHPVRLIGYASDIYEAILRKVGMSGYMGGAALVLAVAATSMGSYFAARLGLGLLHPEAPILLDIFATYSCFAMKDQIAHARPVWLALEQSDLNAAQAAVQKIVGRDAGLLDLQGVGRAAIESVAESFVDGFFSPIFWFVAGALSARFIGIPPAIGATGGALIYRSVNTLDSMVGYRDSRYKKFGYFAARLDDILNFIPARLSVFGLFIGAIICRQKPLLGLKVFWHDRLKHASPNSGHAESFVAGALDLCLGGPTEYSFGVVEKPYLGHGSRNATPRHLKNSVKLVLGAGWFFIFLTVAVFAVSLVLNSR